MKTDRSVLHRFPSDQNATGRSFGPDELNALAEVLQSGTLIGTKGKFVKGFEAAFQGLLAMPAAVACSSGTAAMHAAVAALELEPGDEIVTSPVTDMGAITPILFQGCIPLFADVDPNSANVTADTIASVLSERTRAVIVTHLFGNPCDMSAITRLAKARELFVIEDCSQAFLAKYQGHATGTLGDIGVFSLQQGKHITCGEGGIAVAKDLALARRMRLFVNKAWDFDDPEPDHGTLALNYRMTELQAAVALAQLGRLEEFVATRRDRAAEFESMLVPIDGISAPSIVDGGEHSFWRYPLRIDRKKVGSPSQLAKSLAVRGITSSPGYIRKPAFQCGLFSRQQTFGKSRWPFTLARPEAVDYRLSRFPGVTTALSEMLVLPWNERLTSGDVKWLAAGIAEAVSEGEGGA